MVKDCIHNLCPHTLGLSKVQWSEKSTVPLRMELCSVATADEDLLFSGGSGLCLATKEMVDALTNQRNILQTEDAQNLNCIHRKY